MDVLEKLKLKKAQASRLLDSEIFKIAVRDVQNDLTKEWINSGVKNSEEREVLYIAMRQLSDVVKRLNRYVIEAEHQERVSEHGNKSK